MRSNASMYTCNLEDSESSEPWFSGLGVRNESATEFRGKLCWLENPDLQDFKLPQKLFAAVALANNRGHTL